MRRPLAWAFAVVMTVLCDLPALNLKAQSATPPRHITRKELLNRVRGGWAGQMIGVTFGAPTEFQYLGKMIDGDLPPWRPEQVRGAIDQDDLYVEMTFAEVMDRIGLDATTQQYGEAFRDSKFMVWHANSAARRVLKEGIEAPRSGQPAYNPHANDIDFQIESDFIGLMSPGLPQAARDYGLRVGMVMSSGDGLNGGLFISGMYTAAFFETDTRRVVEAGLAMLPPSSGYAAAIRDVLEWHTTHPQDWQSAWRMLEERWNKTHACPEVRSPMNIDARLNGAYVAVALLYGERDFTNTVHIGTRLGQDSDCNPSSAAGILGVMLGYNAIPGSWRSGIPDMADRKFAETNYSFEEIVASTVKRAEQVVRLAGGTVTDDAFEVPAQTAEPPSVEQWNVGAPERVISISDPAWQWSAEWGKASVRTASGDAPAMIANAAGATATLTFTGTAVTILGGYGQAGGRAEVWLDGDKAFPVSTWISERTHDHAHWQTYGLTPGTHVLKVVTTGVADAQSADTAVEITSALVYRIR